jgi:hypothetical protein
MRTKALLGLAVLAAGLTTALADGVYSANVVGYVNVTLTANKLHFLSLPLQPTDGNYDLNNTVQVGDVQEDAKIYAWDTTKWNNTVPQWIGGYGWDPTLTISNGVGFFLKAKATADSVLTFVGEVPQSTIAPIAYNIPAGLSTLGNKIPVSGNFPGADIGHVDDKMYEWDFVNQKWANNVYVYLEDYGWSDNTGSSNDVPAGPWRDPGQALFYQNFKTDISFTRDFTVGP